MTRRLQNAAGRSTPEWQGASPDTPVPNRVRLRVFERAEGRCHRCCRKIGADERWTLEHLTALVLGGENRERNLGVTCDWCLPEKNAEDVAAKSRSYRKRLANHGLKQPKGRGFQKLYKGRPIKHKVGGGIVDRETGEPIK